MTRDFQTLISSPTATYAEGISFFNGTGMLNDALTRLARALEQHDIDYAVVGAVALNQHGFQRFTTDIDILLTADGLEQFRDKLVGLGYRPAFEGARKNYRTTDGNVPIDIIISGGFPGDGLPKPVAFPEPSGVFVSIDGIKTITLEKLIDLKLASGLTATDRLKDLADVQELIKAKLLDESFAERLNEYVREKFIELCRGVTNARGGDLEHQ
ncbi:MAG: nucleotidyl transferase AbiEii/AbiGii toxin family protein [Pyrinomonadaceae bacterium]